MLGRYCRTEKPQDLMGSVLNFIKYSPTSVDPLVSMFNGAFSNNKLPQTLREANIALILKKGECPESCGSYRPVSLLNVDQNIL